MNNNFTLNEGFNPKGQSELILKNFGLSFIKPKFYQVNGGNVATLQELAKEDGQRDKQNSFFGLPVFDVLTFMGMNYIAYDGKKITLDTIHFGVALCDINQSKNIITTSIQGRNGTIKEYISDGDYTINIKGVITSAAQDYYPEQNVKRLKDFCDAPTPISIASQYINMFGIKDIVIKDYSFAQVEGMRNVQPFELNCLSETPFEIKSQTQNTTAGTSKASPRFI
jgi:hypothetical protein